MRFANKVVIVTGGAKGIGAGCCRVFAKEGATVALFDIDDDAGKALAEELTNDGPGTAHYFPCDAAHPEAIEATVQKVAEQFGRIDSLVNNVGVHPPATPIEENSIPDLERLLRINFVSTFAASRAAVPFLRKTKGTIVNMSSMTAVLGQEHSSAYAATKGAQLSFTKALAVELGPDGIRVNAVLPSNVDTPLMRDWASTLPDPESAMKRVAELQVFGRMADPEEIGRVCLFLACEDSSFVTGQGLEVEGGASLDY
ncbi:MAG: glucose 1-dehydrogenase [Planctomycetaceae bacterium]|nr:glucose 1-dehydrogenase [Planctomycetaceae bacterium]